MVVFSLIFQEMADERFGLQLSLFQQPNRFDANVDARKVETSNDEEETSPTEKRKNKSKKRTTDTKVATAPTNTSPSPH